MTSDNNEDLKAVVLSLRDRQNAFEEQMQRHAERLEAIVSQIELRSAKHDYEIVELRRDTRELMFENQRILRFLESQTSN